MKFEKAPTLETLRLRMRPYTAQDFPAMAKMWANPEVVRFIGFKPCSPFEVWSRLLRYAGLWPILGFGNWAVEEKASGKFVGDVGLLEFKRELQPSIIGVPELGWVLAPEFYGKGYATEAVNAAAAWGDQHLESQRIVCIIAKEHAASLRVAEKCGFQDRQPVTYHDEEIWLLSRARRP